MEVPVPFPLELRPYRPAFDQYLNAKLRQFGSILVRKLGHNWANEQVKQLLDETMAVMMQQDAAAAPQRPLRLVIRHDCQSTGCGEMGCVLCQYNPSRLCTRNVKQKYLIDDHLKAKCGAPLRVELVDDTGACHTEGLAPGVQLEMHVLNGEKYKELCPDNTLLSISAIKNCIISHHSKALLRREGMSEDQLRVYLPLERGTATVSDLTLTTSSEALLSGKAPTFRLLVWAVEANGEPVPNVTYVVSESFVVATKRVKHAIKSDIPSVGDHISKLLHIGKATVDKLTDLRTAFVEEGFDVKLPESLLRVEKVGQFRQLVEMSEGNNDLKNKLRHVLKLSPEKWDEVCQHALSAVVPDFRNRVWWCPQLRLGLLYACKNGAIMMESPIGIVRQGVGQEPATVVPLQSLSPSDFNAIPRLKQNALQNWYMPNHPQWAILPEMGDEAQLAGPGGGLPVAPAAAAAVGAPVVPPTAATTPGVGMPPLSPGLIPVAGPQPPPAAAAAYLQAAAAPSPGLCGLGPGMPGGPYGGELYGTPGVAYGTPDGPYGIAGPGGMGLMVAAVPGMPTPGHRTSNATPFAIGQTPQQPQQQPQAAGKGPPQQAAQQTQQQPQQVAAAPQLQQPGQRDRQASHPRSHSQQQQQQGPPAGRGPGSGTSSGLGHAMMRGPLHMAASGPSASGGSSNSAGHSAFANDASVVNSIANAFPDFPPALGLSPGQGDGTSAQGRNDPHGVANHHPVGVPPAGAGAPGQPQGPGSMYSLDMLKTEELIDRGMSIFSLPLGTNDTFRSNDWLGQLHGVPGQPHGLGGVNSYTMLDVGPPHGAGGGLLGDGDGAAGGGGQIGGGGGGPGGVHGGGGHGVQVSGLDSERRLSLKMNSMSLDLDKVIAEHAGQ